MWTIRHGYQKPVTISYWLRDPNWQYCLRLAWRNLLFRFRLCHRFVVVNLYFVHGYETAQKVVRISVEQCQTLLPNFHKIVPNVSKRGTHNADSLLTAKWSSIFEPSEPCEMPMASTIWGTFNLKFVDFSIVSGVVTLKTGKFKMFRTH